MKSVILFKSFILIIQCYSTSTTLSVTSYITLSDAKAQCFTPDSYWDSMFQVYMPAAFNAKRLKVQMYEVESLIENLC